MRGFFVYLLLGVLPMMAVSQVESRCGTEIDVDKPNVAAYRQAIRDCCTVTPIRLTFSSG